jgi:hypothetical protein
MKTKKQYIRIKRDIYVENSMDAKDEEYEFHVDANKNITCNFPAFNVLSLIRITAFLKHLSSKEPNLGSKISRIKQDLIDSHLQILAKYSPEIRETAINSFIQWLDFTNKNGYTELEFLRKPIEESKDESVIDDLINENIDIYEPEDYSYSDIKYLTTMFGCFAAFSAMMIFGGPAQQISPNVATKSLEIAYGVICGIGLLLAYSLYYLKHKEEKVTETNVTFEIEKTRDVLCASPEYLAKHGIPKKPADLLNLDYIAHTQR